MAGSKERPRPWLPLDQDFFAQDTIQELGQRFGPAGPLTFLAALTEAKRYAASGVAVKKQGTVDIRYAALARTAFLEAPGKAQEIIGACVELGLLEMLDGSTDQRFKVRFLKWDRWETKDSGAAQRQARNRAKQEPVNEPDEDPYPF